jgi:hypothetical protein
MDSGTREEITSFLIAKTATADPTSNGATNQQTVEENTTRKQNQT